MVAIVELQSHESGDFYSVVIAFKIRGLKGDNLLWSGAPSRSDDSGLQPALHNASHLKASGGSVYAKQKEDGTTLPDNLLKSRGNLFSISDETGAQQMQRLRQDDENRWQVTQEAIDQQGGRFTPSNDVYPAMERMPGYVAAKF